MADPVGTLVDTSVLLDVATGDPVWADWSSQALAGAVGAAASWWIDHRSVPRQRLTEHLTTLLWDGLGASAAGWGAIDESVVVSDGRIDTPADRHA